jgi:hypothetical protein
MSHWCNLIHLSRSFTLAVPAFCMQVHIADIFLTRAPKDDKAWQVLRIEIYGESRMQGWQTMQNEKSL